MNQKKRLFSYESQEKLTRAYETEKPRLMARVRAAGKSLEETEDIIHDIYTETWGRLDRLVNIINLPAWLNSLVTRRLIDAWRHEKVRKEVGETDVAEDTLREVIAGVGLDPLDDYVRRCLVEALDEALKSLPAAQRKVVEAQVFGGQTFAELAAATGESIDTLKARKRYAVKNLSRALKHWIND
ncbi:MAG: RNA polymerase sigma factor [Spirochaetaceae bacterium]|jgi:RNA polymerase sigma factor (sigma-70 family)|nr:RNA polymerase sigma factor [Spirochaetaceae bacterium]